MRAPTPASRRRNDPHALGRAGEERASWWLQARGMTIVAQRLRIHGGGEIDVLVRQSRGPRWWPLTWPFGWRYIAVEVKTRVVDAAPERAADDARIQRLQGALARLAPFLRPAPTELAVDVLAIRFGLSATKPEVAHFPGPRFDPPRRPPPRRRPADRA